jgi:hypothetical protein
VSSYYKRDGTPVSSYQEAFSDETHVAQEVVSGYYVSTVHLGMNHQWGDGPPLIFETMVFKAEGDGVASYTDLYCDRYSTEAEAKAGHAAVVERLKAGTLELYE